MKVWLTFLLISLLLSKTVQGSSFQKLIEVNPAWRLHGDMVDALLDSASIPNERAWVNLHLGLVEQSLRKGSETKWSGKQIFNRLHCLDLLRAYTQAGKFPVNEDYSFRTPIFIDGHDNFCAVGFLIKETGHQAFSRKVAAVNNLVRIRDLEGPELFAWAEEYGFTIDELAWIQPSYAPTGFVQPIGKGVNGYVNELYVDDSEGKLYVGGVFSRVDDSIPSRNIAYLTEAGGVYTWHRIGGGSPYGGVNAITKYQGKIYVGGRGGVTSWEGYYWADVGCLNGDVYDLQVLDGELYACGWIGDCTWYPSYFNFAHWNGTNWDRIDGVKGVINTMFVQDTTLILGGNLIYNNTQLNVVKWSTHAGFRSFASGIVNEVRDFGRFYDTLYAACRRTNNVDSVNLVVRLVDDHWTTPKLNTLMNRFLPFNNEVSFNTLCADGNMLMTGGSFLYDGSIWGLNTVCLRTQSIYGGTWFNLDSTVNKMVVFKKDFIVGGLFRRGGGVTLNGIGKRPATRLSAEHVNRPNTFEVYPNPAHSAGTITIRSSFSVERFAIYAIDGRCLSGGVLRSQQSPVMLPELSPGMYILALVGMDGARATGRLLIE